MGEPEVITNPRSERVRVVASLQTSAGRRRHGHFVVEGPHAVGELIAATQALRVGAVGAGGWHVVAVYATADPAVAGTVRTARAAGVTVRMVSVAVLGAMTAATTPQGVLAVAALPVTPDRSRSTVAEWPTTGFGVFLVEVRDPGNVGTVIRAADAAGAAVVAMSPASADPYAPKAVRASAGSLFHVPVVTSSDVDATMDAAHDHGWTVLGTAADGALSLDDIAMPGAAISLTTPHLWVLGNESSGLGEDVRRRTDAVVRIPIRGRAESLNLAMAATLLLFASGRLMGPPA